ncbi:MAG TPA: biotin/lipoyl-containing protein, partial [Gemmatimonadaceae bacterium]|nr:biotin/lipoyl-containing protein [Gemmatimonadaceae bacterium]
MTAIKVPPLGESIVEATISRWLKKEGDQIAVGDTLVELETDKITVEVPAMNAGVLTKRAHAEGDVVKVDDLLAEIDESGAGAAPAAAAPATTPAAAPPPAATPPAASKAAPPVVASAPSPTPTEVRASPAAQRVAAERGIDLSTVAGTGRGGVVSKPDVIESADSPSKGDGAAAPVPKAQPAAPEAPRPTLAPAASGARETREKMSTRRKRIAEHLLEAQHATAHLTTFNEIDMSAVIAVRERHKDRVEKQYGVKLSFMPFFAKAACLALKQYPTVN